MVRVPRNQPLTGDQRNSFIAALLGWTMDAFDYFLVVLVYADIAKTFHHTKAEVAFLTTATLLMRPVGALLFGLWADRVGRRLPLMVDVVFYSVVGFLCAFAPEFHRPGDPATALRHRHGRGMGSGCRARDGESARRAPRVLFRSAARGLRIRLSAGDSGVAAGDGLAGSVMAMAVRAECHTGAGQSDHSVPREGVRSLGNRAAANATDTNQDS